MASLSKPKHGDPNSYRSRTARWRLEKRVDPKLVKKGNHKDTRKWCKGKTGVLHDWAWRDWHNYCYRCGRERINGECPSCHAKLSSRWRVQVCRACDKQGKLERK